MYFDEIKTTQQASSWTKHPSSRWYEWKGAKFGYKEWSKKKVKIEDWAFEYWDRDVQNADWSTWARVSVPLKEMPKEFIVIAETWSLGGWDEANRKPLHGPEVDSRYNDTMVALRKDGSIFWKGKWTELEDNKNNIHRAKDMWLVLYRNLHVFDPKNPDSFFTIKLHDTQSMEWYWTFSKEETKNSYFWKRVAFWDEKECVKWTTQWTLPTYVVGGELTEEDKANRKKFADMIRDYHVEVDRKDPEEDTYNEVQQETQQEEVDELPF